MSDTLALVGALVRRGSVRISVHGYDELTDDGIFIADILAGIDTLAWSRTIPMPRMAHASLRFKSMAPDVRFTWYGASRAGGRNLLQS